jgi:hypothetical protein
VAFTFDPALGDDISKIRMVIGDADNTTDKGVKPDGTNYRDEELHVLLTAAGGRWVRAVPIVLRALSTLYSQRAYQVQAVDYSENLSGVAAAYEQRAAAWEKGVPGVWSGLISFNAATSTPTFTEAWGPSEDE